MSVYRHEGHNVRDLSAIPVNGKQLEIAQNAVILEKRITGDILHVFGELDLTNVDELRGAIDRAAASDSHVIVDLEPCTYVDSTILSVLMRASETYAGRFQIVVPPSGIVRRVFVITSLITQLPVIDKVPGSSA